MAKLKVPEVAQKFEFEIRNRFSCLGDDETNNSDDVQHMEKNGRKSRRRTKTQLKRFWGSSQG